MDRVMNDDYIECLCDINGKPPKSRPLERLFIFSVKDND